MSTENLSKRAQAIKAMIDSNHQAHFAWMERTTEKIGFIFPASLTLGTPFTEKTPRTPLKNFQKYNLPEREKGYVYTVVEQAAKTQLDAAGYAERVPMFRRALTGETVSSAAASSTAEYSDAYQGNTVILSVNKQFSRVAGNHAATFQAIEEEPLLADQPASSGNDVAKSEPKPCCRCTIL